MAQRQQFEEDSSATAFLHASLPSAPSRAESLLSSIASLRSDLSNTTRWKNSSWRHPLGISLILVTVILWTTSNFLASTIFADNTYSKPFFVTYTNSVFFLIPLVPMTIKQYLDDPSELHDLWDAIKSGSLFHSRVSDRDDTLEDPFLKPTSTGHNGEDGEDGQAADRSDLEDDSASVRAPNRGGAALSYDRLTLIETVQLSFEFCFLWVAANYFSIACLEYTTVGSATILTSTSSIWTLLCGTILGVERFTIRKLLGVLASLAGIILISSVDASSGDDKNRGTFPHKTNGEIIVGDILAFISAVIYGIYAVVLKKRVGNEGRVSMPIFFGVVGLLNVLFIWPVFFILHFTGIERFELPTDPRVLTIILVNSTTSMVSDFSWAFAMLLISPLVVTVGLCLTIPLSLIGQMFINELYSGFTYWLGACVVFLSFIFINHEEAKEEAEEDSGLHESGILNGAVDWTTT